MKIRAKMAPNVCRKTHEDLFGGHTKKMSSWSMWEKIYRQSRTKTFRASLGKFGQKSFAPPKIFLLLHLRTSTLHLYSMCGG